MDWALRSGVPGESEDWQENRFRDSVLESHGRGLVSDELADDVRTRFGARRRFWEPETSWDPDQPEPLFGGTYEPAGQSSATSQFRIASEDPPDDDASGGGWSFWWRMLLFCLEHPEKPYCHEMFPSLFPPPPPPPETDEERRKREDEEKKRKEEEEERKRKEALRSGWGKGRHSYQWGLARRGPNDPWPGHDWTDPYFPPVPGGGSWEESGIEEPPSNGVFGPPPPPWEPQEQTCTPLTTQRLRAKAKELKIGAGKTGGPLNEEIGWSFEEFALKAMGLVRN